MLHILGSLLIISGFLIAMGVIVHMLRAYSDKIVAAWSYQPEAVVRRVRKPVRVKMSPTVRAVSRPALIPVQLARCA